jgi:hypothetical protein
MQGFQSEHYNQESKRNCLYKNDNHQQMHKESFIINCNTLLHVSTLLGHLQGELFVIGTADSSRLQYTVHSQQHIVTQL